MLTGFRTNKFLRPFLSLLPREDWLVASWVLATKALILGFGILSYSVLQNVDMHGLQRSLAIWHRWDSRHYLALAQYGYKPPGLLRHFAPNFYPLYPWLVRLCHALIHNYRMAALFVSGLALLATAILLRRLVARDFEPALALRAVWFFLIFPTAYFLHIGYAESLFLALVLGAILSARMERWWLTGILGGLACLTRPTGIVLIPTLTVEALHQFWSGDRRWRWHWLWLLLVPCGWGCYLLLNRWSAGDPFAFLQMRKQYFHASFAPPWTGVLDAWGNRHQRGAAGVIAGQQEFVFLMLGLVCAVVSWFRLRPIYATWMTANWLLFASADFIASTPRYTLTMFPIFILFAILGRNRFWNMAVTVWSLLFLSFFAALFTWGRWAY